MEYYDPVTMVSRFEENPGRTPLRFSFACRSAIIARRATEVCELSATSPLPTEIKLHQVSRVLELTFSDGRAFRLPCEFLRVFSPSAEVRGHGPGQEVLQVGKKEVTVTAIEPVGSYAVKLVFSDGHDTGLYTWDYLYELGSNHERLWQGYLERLRQAGASRDPVGVARASASTWKKL
jgi:DUF971 family protein